MQGFAIAFDIHLYRRSFFSADSRCRPCKPERIRFFAIYGKKYISGSKPRIMRCTMVENLQNDRPAALSLPHDDADPAIFSRSALHEGFIRISGKYHGIRIADRGKHPLRCSGKERLILYRTEVVLLDLLKIQQESNECLRIIRKVEYRTSSQRCGTYHPQHKAGRIVFERMPDLFFHHKYPIGSTACPLISTSKWQCGPVEFPVEPAKAMTSPFDTDCPSDTLRDWLCPYSVCIPPP